tara:strand:- start:11499 stop:12041 length:543 start_codon:yes stop_codon:yes gene_type:complete
MKLLLLTFVSYVSAFLNVNPRVKSFAYYGSTAPLKNFDPLNILKGKSENKIKFVREAELQHGRAAMLATTAIPIIEKLDGGDSLLGVNYLSSLDLNHQLPFWLTVMSYEVTRMNNGWVNPFTTNTTFTLKTEYQPGNLGNYYPESISEDLYNKELNNGRLAMIAFFGILGQELVVGQHIF